jgi:hypothetical protein
MLKMGSINTPILVAVVSCPQDPESRIRRRPVCVWYLWKWGYEAREDDDFVKRKYGEDRKTQNRNTEELHLGAVIFQKLVWKEKPLQESKVRTKSMYHMNPVNDRKVVQDERVTAGLRRSNIYLSLVPAKILLRLFLELWGVPQLLRQTVILVASTHTGLLFVGQRGCVVSLWMVVSPESWKLLSQRLNVEWMEKVKEWESSSLKGEAGADPTFGVWPPFSARVGGAVCKSRVSNGMNQQSKTTSNEFSRVSNVKAHI